MKKCFVLLIVTMSSFRVSAQAQEVQQLLLNVEKLAQFKQILQDMYDGWKIINKGYHTIKDISSGNFSLHKGFLDGLMEVSPVVKRYKRVADIVNYQLLIVKRYKAALAQFKDDDVFTVQEILYMEKVYSNLFRESLKNLDELYLVVTAGQLRMSDDERLRAIDKIYERVEDQFAFLEDFNSSTGYLSLQRKAEQAELNTMKKLHGG
jgi:hypothetical protein